MNEETQIVVCFCAAVLFAVGGCASSPDFGTVAWVHDRNRINSKPPIFPPDSERSRWVTRSGAGRD